MGRHSYKSKNFKLQKPLTFSGKLDNQLFLNQFPELFIHFEEKNISVRKFT